MVVPSRPEFIHVLRAVTASVAARLDYSYDEIEDLRLAVDEACALLLTDGGRSTDLQLVITPSDDGVEVVVCTNGEAAEWPLPRAPESLAWQILGALADGVEYVRWEGMPAVRLAKRLHAAEGPASVGPPGA